MSDTEQTRMMGGSTVMPGFGATQQMPAGTVMGGDPFRTQMGGTTPCPVCQTVTPLGEAYCAECGFLVASATGNAIEVPEEEVPIAVLVDGVTGRRYPLHIGENTIGRQGTDVVAADGTVSRVHARITIDGDVITVEDLGSSNGTKVGDTRYGANQPVPAKHGTPIKFGNWRVMLEVGGAPAPSAERTVFISEVERTVVAPSPPLEQPERTVVAAVPPSVASVAAPESPSPDAMSEPPHTPSLLDAGEAMAILQKTAGLAPDIPITPGTITIGRKQGNDVILVGDAYISGRHAELTTDNSGTYLTDLGSTNGTVVNGEKLTPNERQLLLEGDEVQLGQSRFLFRWLDLEGETGGDMELGVGNSGADAL